MNIANKEIELKWGAKEFVLPFSILLNDFKLERYPGSNAPSAYSSEVKVYDNILNNSFEYLDADGFYKQWEAEYKIFDPIAKKIGLKK